MANRPQDWQSSRRMGQDRSRDDDNRRYPQNYGRDYGNYTDTDEGDSSVRAGDWNQGRGESDQGRGGYGGYGGYGTAGRDWTSQGRSDYPRYGEEFGSSGTSEYGRSRYGSSQYGSQESRQGGGYGQGGRAFSGYGYEGSGGERGYGGGEHRGKGPKNYQRSDDRLKEMICERLREDPDIDASEITINVQGGIVTLDGSVDSRRTKNAAEDVAEQFGVHDVQNNLRVQRPGQQGSSDWGKTAAGSEGMEGSRQKRN